MYLGGRLLECAASYPPTEFGTILLPGPINEDYEEGSFGVLFDSFIENLCWLPADSMLCFY